MGAAVNALPGAEIVPALDRGLIEAAEFNNASSDRALGFQDVSKICMLQSYHQNAEQFEILFNKTKFDALPDKMKAIIAVRRRMRRQPDMSWKAIDRYSKDYIELQTKEKVRFYRTPDSVLQKQLEVFDQVEAKKVGREYPTFKEIAESQRAFAARAVKWDLDTNVGRRMAYNHYFAKPGAKPAAPAAKPAARPQPPKRVSCSVMRQTHFTSHPALAGWLVFFQVLDERPTSAPLHRRDQLLVRQGLRVADRRTDLRGLHRSLQALHSERADGVDFRL